MTAKFSQDRTYMIYAYVDHKHKIAHVGYTTMEFAIDNWNATLVVKDGYVSGANVLLTPYSKFCRGAKVKLSEAVKDWYTVMLSEEIVPTIYRHSLRKYETQFELIQSIRRAKQDVTDSGIFVISA